MIPFEQKGPALKEKHISHTATPNNVDRVSSRLVALHSTSFFPFSFFVRYSFYLIPPISLSQPEVGQDRVGREIKFIPYRVGRVCGRFQVQVPMGTKIYLSKNALRPV